MKIKLLKDIPSFVGFDMEEYPETKKNEIKDFPEKIAKIFIQRKIAELVE